MNEADRKLFGEVRQYARTRAWAKKTEGREGSGPDMARYQVKRAAEDVVTALRASSDRSRAKAMAALLRPGWRLSGDGPVSMTSLADACVEVFGGEFDGPACSAEDLT